MTITPQQMQLFDPRTTRRQEPGEMTPDKWMSRPDVAFHGTFNPSWETAPLAHYGTAMSAHERMDKVSKNFLGEESGRRSYFAGGKYEDEEYDDDNADEDRVPSSGTGTIHPRRLGRVSGNAPISDAAANKAHYENNYEDGEPIPTSVSGSMTPAGGTGLDFERRDNQAFYARGDLDRGLAVRYHNDAEDEGSISYLAHPRTTSSWADDVRAARPKAPPLSQQMAAHLDRTDQDLTPPIRSVKRVGLQFPLHPAEGHVPGPFYGAEVPMIQYRAEREAPRTYKFGTSL